MFITNDSSTISPLMSEHRIALDTLDARWGRYRALISRSDKLQRKSVMTPSSVIAVIGHPLSIPPHTPAFSLMCVSINPFDMQWISGMSIHIES